MSLEALLQLSLLIISSFSIAFMALWALARLDRTSRTAAVGFMSQPEESIAFLFDDQVLVNATKSAEQIMTTTPSEGTDWARLLAALQPRFPSLHDEIATLAEQGTIQIQSLDGSAHLDASWQGGLARISLVETQGADTGIKLDRPHFDAMELELETLRATAESAPFLVWRQSGDGTITWANSSYLDIAQASDSETPTSTWPPAHLFDLANSSPDEPVSASTRVTTHIAGEAEPRWFECFETRLGDESLFTAVAADKVVKAEVALRDFVQTLTKTFAHLTVGLAIFDKQRRLALFNPALTDLTSLPVAFLSGRPTFQTVLDRLREKHMIPEPKDYKSWRRELYELEAAAANGTYEETWSLANGRTYRVTGRPHPDGAVAFLFEDISAEISLTRRFRAELENGQAVLDSFNEAIAVFSPTGALTLSNVAYCKLWEVDTTAVLGNFGIVDASRAWSEKCIPSPVWGDAREFVGTIGERAEWQADVQLADGRWLICRFAPISGGATLAGFRLNTGQPNVLPKETDVPLLLGTDSISA